MEKPKPEEFGISEGRYDELYLKASELARNDKNHDRKVVGLSILIGFNFLFVLGILLGHYEPESIFGGVFTLLVFSVFYYKIYLDIGVMKNKDYDPLHYFSYIADRDFERAYMFRSKEIMYEKYSHIIH